MAGSATGGSANGNPASSGGAAGPKARTAHSASRRFRPMEPKASASARVSRLARLTPARRQTAWGLS